MFSAVVKLEGEYKCSKIVGGAPFAAELQGKIRDTGVRMSGTKIFQESSIGVGAHNSIRDVKVLQQLLAAAGETVNGGDDGHWGLGTHTALRSFLKAEKAQKPRIEPTRFEKADGLPLRLARAADILIPLPGVIGLPGIDALHKWFVDEKIKYQAGAEDGNGNRCVYGVDGHREYAVQTKAQKFSAGPVQMDCTTYANLMFSVYIHGNAHNPMYDGDCGRVGGVSSFHLARDRYRFNMLRRPDKGRAGEDTTVTDFRTAEQILTATQAAGAGLYALEPAEFGTGAVKHVALLYGTDVYECSNATAPNCIQHRLTEFMNRCIKNGRFCYLFGPK